VGTVVGGIILMVMLIIIIIFVVRKNNYKKARKEVVFTETNEIAFTNDIPTIYKSMSGTCDESSDEKVSSEKVSNVKGIIQYGELHNMKKIGEGEFGVVYQAKWRNSNVAVKQLKNAGLDSRKSENFFMECEFMRNLQPHPNVVIFFGICQEPLCLITEYCANGDLKSLLRKKSINIKLKRKIIADVAAGMFHLENENIVHRDLAARNCLLMDNYITKVSDFGLSKLDGDIFNTSSEYGKWALKWLSPETLKLHLFNNKTDVWSFGILLIEVFYKKGSIS